MNDLQEIQSLFQKSEPYIESYESESWNYLTDYNNMNYQSQVSFNTKDTKDKLVVWRDGFMTWPILIAPTASTPVGNLYSNATKLALKNSVLSLIYGVQINQISAGSILNENQVQFINNLRLILDNSSDFLTAKASELMFGIDNVVWSAAAPASKPTDVAGTAITNNEGFLNRITFVQQNGTTSFIRSAAAVSCYSFLAYIPLKYIHPIFECLDFPMLGSNLEINILHSFGTNNLYPPVMTDSSSLLVKPEISIAPSAILSQKQCRLYYKSVKLHPKEGQIFLDDLKKGHTITRSYLACDTYAQSYKASTTGQPFNNSIIANNVINPTAVYILGFPQDAMTGPAYTPVTNVMIAGSGNLPLSGIGGLTNVNMTLNGTNAFPDTQLITYLDFWNQLKPRMLGENDLTCAPISYSDFLNSQRIHYFDISKVAKQYDNQPVSIYLTASRDNQIGGVIPDSTAVDWVILVEKRMTIKINQSSNGCVIISGSNV
jgi:hypothetical protein